VPDHARRRAFATAEGVERVTEGDRRTYLKSDEHRGLKKIRTEGGARSFEAAKHEKGIKGRGLGGMSHLFLIGRGVKKVKELYWVHQKPRECGVGGVYV